MTGCPFKTHCKNTKTQILKFEFGGKQKSIKVCEKCPLLLNASKNTYEFKKCLKCHITLDEIVKTQKTGCPYCFLFMNDLDKLIHAAQNNNTKHTGKRSKTLLINLFQDAIDEHKKNKPEDAGDCDLLKTLIQDLF